MSRLTDEQIKKITAQVISCCCKEPVTTPLVQCCGGTFFVRNRYDEWAYLDGQEFTPAQNAPCFNSTSGMPSIQYPCVNSYEWLDGDLYYKEANCLGTINLTKIASGGTAPNLNRFSSKSRYYLWTADMDSATFSGKDYQVILFYDGQQVYSGTYNSSDYSSWGNNYAFLKQNGTYPSVYNVFYKGQQLASKNFNTYMPNTSSCGLTAGMNASIFIDGSEYEREPDDYADNGLYYYKDSGTGSNKKRTFYFNGQELAQYNAYSLSNIFVLPYCGGDMFYGAANFDNMREEYFNGVKYCTQKFYRFDWTNNTIKVYYGLDLFETIDTSDIGTTWNGGNSYTSIYYNINEYSNPKTITKTVDIDDYDGDGSSHTTTVIGTYTDDPPVSMPQVSNLLSCCGLLGNDSYTQPALLKKDGMWCVPVFNGGAAWTFNEFSDGSNDVSLCCNDMFGGNILDKTQKKLFNGDGGLIGTLNSDFSDSKPEYLPGGRTSIGCCGQTRLYRPTETEQLIDVETYEAGLMQFNIDTWERLDNAV